MNKFQLKMFLKAAYEIILVFLQFFIISLHFFKWEFFPEKQIIQVTPFSYFVGFLIIIIISLEMFLKLIPTSLTKEKSFSQLFFL